MSSLSLTPEPKRGLSMLNLKPSFSLKDDADPGSPIGGRRSSMFSSFPDGDIGSPRTIRSLDKQFSGENDATNHNVRVALRIRPFLPREIAKDVEEGLERGTSVLHVTHKTVTVLDPANKFQPKDAFEFDEVFWGVPAEQNSYECDVPITDQGDVYNVVGAPAVTSALRGYNACLFAYGQTGSGKTHTMLGTPQDPGIAPRLVRSLFAELLVESQNSDPTLRMESTVELSFLEIYNEKVKDLLLKSQGLPSLGSFRRSQRRASKYPAQRR